MIPALTNEFAIHNSVPSLYATYVDTLQKKISFKNTLFFSPKCDLEVGNYECSNLRFIYHNS